MTFDDRQNAQTTQDDPKLRAAIRRTWGAETAPADLRSRIESLITQQRELAQGPGDVIHVAPSFWRRPYVRVVGATAAAAVVVLGAALAFQMSRPGSTGEVASSAASSSSVPSSLPNLSANTASVTPASAALPADLSNQVVKSHDTCVRVHPDQHHFFKGAPKDNFKLIAERMAARVKYPVVATTMGGDWNFKGASMCPVGGKSFPHMMYKSGDAYLSVFSLPASAVPDCPKDYTADATVSDHPVAAFAADGACYFVVASTGGKTPVDLEQVRALRDQVRGEVISFNRTPAGINVVAAATVPAALP